ncbi:unnamed protein product [Owenia fusiformis]|uniref:Uncharacterized protein n=1 Tax=Owenia fusiformis TaxID=6347 RepID=A0A8S4Q9A9_OWEFU|nr:unnamed protein product [Owenia fusiformis]
MNSSTGRVMDIQEAVSQGLIETIPSRMSLTEAAKEGIYFPDTGIVIDPKTGKEMSLREAITIGIIDATNTILAASLTGSAMSLEEAINAGIFDTETGIIVNEGSNKSSTFSAAMHDGHILTPKSLTLHSVILTDRVIMTLRLVKLQIQELARKLH